MEAIELHKLKTLIERNNGHVTYVNTDMCECWFNNDNELDLSVYFWDNDKKLKKYKYEIKKEEPNYERMKGFCHNNNFVDHYSKDWNVIEDPLIDDFSGIVNQVIESNQSFNIDGIAGSGKTTCLRKLMQTLDEKKIKYRCLAPTNKASRQLSKEAMTIHKFLGCVFKNSNTLYDKLEGVEYIIVDEISMVKEIFYSIFTTIKRVKPSIKFILSGDWRQLDPVCDRANFDYKNSRALYEVCDGNRLELTKCRRSDTELFELSLNVLSIIPGKNFHRHEKYQRAICFTNNKRIELNHFWMHKISTKRKQKYLTVEKLEYDPNSQDMRIYKTLPIIARVNNKQYDIVNNETFTVKDIKGDKNVIITDGEIDKNIELKDFNKLFYPSYAITVHKSQGTTIDEGFSIYEWHMFCHKMMYTALTRATKLNNVNIMLK